MHREEHMLGELHAYRYCGPKPKYALVVSHGIGGHGGIYDVFCTHHAAKGADIWSYSAPGHGQSTTTRPRGQWTMTEWTAASVAYAEHVKAKTGLPVFTLGSSLGVAAAFSALHSDAITGAILMGSPAIPSGAVMELRAGPWRSDAGRELVTQLGRAARLDIGTLFNFDEDYGYNGASEQKRLDPWNTWTYDLASWASLFQFEPEIKAANNTKPIFIAAGEKDPNFPPAVMTLAANSVAGPVELKIFDGASHQLMLFHTVPFSTDVDNFVRKHI
jgi:pimeloyl-ACP methyl ester carboxylesterase